MLCASCLIAGLVVLYLAVVVYNRFIRGGKNLLKYGKWAIVTGGTDGIGLAVAREFGAYGLSVLVISRNEERLQKAKEKIFQSARGAGKEIEVETLKIDFSTWGAEDKKRLQDTVDRLDVGILVNNVGVSYVHPEFLHNLDESELGRILDVNVSATTYVTHAVLKGMVERHRGAIVNVGSATGQFAAGTPLLSVYAASKAYVDCLSRSLQAEYARHNIEVQCQFPMFVSTKMARVRPSFFNPTPRAFAKSVVHHIGYESSVTPFWPHALQFGFMNALPVALFKRLQMKALSHTRSRALQKKAKKAK